MQRCPAVPTAENTIARIAMSRSAEGATIIALLPPSSRIGRPKRAATLGPTIEPMRVEPVAETIGTWRDATSASPIAGPPMTIWARPSGASGPKRLIARSRIFIVASAESGVFSDGFQITGSPQMSASAAFQDQTATGKLNAEMIAHGPKRMPGLRHPVAGALRGDDEAVQLPRQADGEIADVDHLLHFAQALGDDLADLERHERAERLLRGAQFLAKETHELAAPGRGNLAPGEKGVARPVDDRRHVVGRRLPDAGDLGPVDRRADGERAAAKLRRGQPRAFEHVFAGHRFASSVDRFADAARESLSSTPIQPVRQAQPREEGRPLQDFGQITPRARPISLVHGR